MQYEIIFYAGLIGTVVTLIITIIAFFKCNVVENVTDLLGGKLKSSKSIADNKKKKKKTSNKLKSNNKLESNNNTEAQNNHKSENISEKEIVTASNNDEKRVNKSSTNVLGNKSSNNETFPLSSVFLKCTERELSECIISNTTISS